ncbi:MAG: hypothetical protein WCJ51_04035 [Candidatus Moraniibacteriota bacterium]
MLKKKSSLLLFSFLIAFLLFNIENADAYITYQCHLLVSWKVPYISDATDYVTHEVWSTGDNMSWQFCWRNGMFGGNQLSPFYKYCNNDFLHRRSADLLTTQMWGAVPHTNNASENFPYYYGVLAYNDWYYFTSMEVRKYDDSCKYNTCNDGSSVCYANNGTAVAGVKDCCTCENPENHCPGKNYPDSCGDNVCTNGSKASNFQLAPSLKTCDASECGQKQACLCIKQDLNGCQLEQPCNATEKASVCTGSLLNNNCPGCTLKIKQGGWQEVAP